MLGKDDASDEVRYDWREIIRNMNLVHPSLLGKINRVVVDAGHAWAGHDEGAQLQARPDSFVVETDVRNPADRNLLWDSLRCLIARVSIEECRGGPGKAVVPDYCAGGARAVAERAVTTGWARSIRSAQRAQSGEVPLNLIIDPDSACDQPSGLLGPTQSGQGLT